MKIIDIVVLIARVLAISIAFVAIQNFFFALTFYSENQWMNWVTVMYTVCPILIGILIWWMPYSAVRLFTGNIDFHKETETSISAEQFSSICFLVLSLYLSFNVISDAMYWFSILQYSQANQLVDQLTADQKAGINATIVEAVFVILLFFGRKKMIKLFYKLRQ